MMDLIGFHWLDYLAFGRNVNPQEGEAILELGSGYPLHLIYSRKVGPCGRYIGFDNNKKITATSNYLLEKIGLNDHIYHAAGDAFKLDCPKGLFDKIIAVNLWTREMLLPPKKDFYERVYDTLMEGGSYHEKFLDRDQDEGVYQVCRDLKSCGFHEVTRDIVSGGYPFLHWVLQAKK